MKSWLIPFIVSLFSHKTPRLEAELFCVEESFVYTKDSMVLSNFYCVELDSSYYFAWDASLYFKTGTSYFLFKDDKKYLIAIPVDYYYDFEELDECFTLLMNEEGCKPSKAIEIICAAYEKRTPDDFFHWPTALKFFLYTKSSYN